MLSNYFLTRLYGGTKLYFPLILRKTIGPYHATSGRRRSRSSPTPPETPAQVDGSFLPYVFTVRAHSAVRRASAPHYPRESGLGQLN